MHLLQKVKDFEAISKRRRGGPKRRWCDCVKMDMNEFGFTPEMAQDHAVWKRGIASRATLAQSGRDKLEADDVASQFQDCYICFHLPFICLKHVDHTVQSCLCL